MEHLIRFFVALYSYMGQSAPYLVIGYLVVALIREYVPRRVMTEYLGGRGIAPVANALGIGALLPVCSCGSIPLGVGLARSGAARGTVLAFMTSSPAISPVTIILAYTLLTPPLLVAFVATVVVGSFLLGLIGNYVLRDPEAEASLPWGVVANEAVDDCCAPAAATTHRARIRSAVRWAYWDLGADVSLDLLIGLAAAAAIVAFVPSEWVTAWLGQRAWWSLLYVILISIPIYTCSVPSLMIVNGLMLQGASPGAAIAFLVAGPATNLGELNAIRGSLGKRAAWFYIGSLIVVALAGGIVTDRWIFPDDSFDLARTEATAGLDGGPATAISSLPPHTDPFKHLAEHVPLWHYPFMVVLAVVLVLGAARRIHFNKRKIPDETSS